MTLDPGTWPSQGRLIKWATANSVSAHLGFCTHYDRHEEVSLVLYYSCILGSHEIPSASTDQIQSQSPATDALISSPFASSITGVPMNRIDLWE